MIYNEAISSEYGTNDIFVGNSPIAYRPKPTGDDYSHGYFTRWFSQRVNGNRPIEIDPQTNSNIDQNMYKTISLTWQISGPRNNKVVNGIVEKSGVEKENYDEIERVKIDTGVDLSKVLTNPLELWRGY